MKTWMKLSSIFIGTSAIVAFLVCTSLNNEASANDSSILAQGNQTLSPGSPSRGPTLRGNQPQQPPASTPPQGKIPQTQPGNGQSPPIKLHPKPRPSGTDQMVHSPFVPPDGMMVCTYTNSEGVLMVIIVPIGSRCATNADGSVTVIFPDGTMFTVPVEAQGGIFYTPGHDPVIIVPYQGSTVTMIDNGYEITLPDGRVFILPLPTGSPFFWLFPHTPLTLQVPVVPPANSMMCTYTDSSGVLMAVIVPAYSTCRTNWDGSLTITFPDGTQYTIPTNTTMGSIITPLGWHIMVVPYYGTSFIDYGDMGYLVTLPDGSTYWDHMLYPPRQQSYPPQPMPKGLGLSSRNEYYYLYAPGMPPIWSGLMQAVGEPGIEITTSDNFFVIHFPDGAEYYMPVPVAPGAYTWGPFGDPPNQVIYHFAIILRGSTVTSNGDGTYHVEPPPGSGEQSFDFVYP